MRAIVFNKELTYREDYPMPRPGAGEALVRVTCAGVCNTDLEIIKGYMGFSGILGHEFVGVVESCDDKGFVGKRVVGEINLGCGECPYCRKGMRNHCPNRSVLGILNKDGAFADYVTLPTDNLHIIPDSVSDEEAVFVEPLAAAFEILEQVRIRREDSVCVLGDGKLGLLVAEVLQLTGCSLTAYGRHEEKLSILQRRGIKTALAAEPAEGEFDIVVECSGSPSGLASAMTGVRPGGTIVLKTTAARREQIDLNSVVINEITLIGSRCGPFAPAIRALESKSVDVKPLISKAFPLDKGLEAFKYANEKGVLKVLLSSTIS